jgi:hypothetical protein
MLWYKCSSGDAGIVTLIKAAEEELIKNKVGA